MLKTKYITISSGVAPADPLDPQPGENRDHGKKFLLTEMSALRAEKWAMRLTLALTRAGFDVPEGATSWASILAFGIMKGIGSLAWTDAEPLLDEMMACIQIVEDTIGPRTPTEFDIEEVSTRLLLRSEVFELHSNFSPAAIVSQLAATVLMGQQNSPSTQISHPLSEPLSQDG